MRKTITREDILKAHAEQFARDVASDDAYAANIDKLVSEEKERKEKIRQRGEDWMIGEIMRLRLLVLETVREARKWKELSKEYVDEYFNLHNKIKKVLDEN